MTLRRALYASPLAVLVAVFAHIVAFGFGHAPGAERSSELLGALGAALALGIFGAFASGLLGVRATREPDASAWYAPLFLAVAGTASFGCIEFSEGHVVLRALLEVALLSIPLAYLLTFVARSARSVVRAAGASYGNFVCRALSNACLATARIARDAYPCAATSFVARGPLRGRAPPALI